MTIESKFNIGQRIYWMENNKVATAIIKSIQFPRVQILQNKIVKEECMYFVSRTKSSIISWNGGGLYENQIFSNKQALLKSL